MPAVPDGKGLLLDLSHERAGSQDDGRCCLELALAADGSSLPGKGNQEKGAGRAPAQVKGVRRVVIGHEPCSWAMDEVGGRHQAAWWGVRGLAGVLVTRVAVRVLVLLLLPL